MTQIASGATGVHTTVNVAAYDGQMLPLRFTGTDSRGQRTFWVDTVYVEGSPALTEVASAGSLVLDAEADGGRVLYADTTGAVWMRTGSTETLLRAAVHPGTGRLHPWGAIFGGTRVHDWNRGTLHDLGDLSAQLAVEGPWAIYSDQLRLYRRDLNTGTSALIHGNANNWKNDVTAAGVVVFGSSHNAPEADAYEIFRYDGSGLTRLTSSPNAAYLNLYPVTDGTNVLYTRSGSGTTSTMLWRDGSETVLGAAGDYQANSGWIAWAAPDGGGILRIRTRAPDGTDRIVASPSGPAAQGALRVLHSDGTVIYASAGYLYASRAPYTGTPTRIASDWQALGMPRFVDGDLLFFLGRTVFRVNY
jgi:hypothetical protein